MFALAFGFSFLVCSPPQWLTGFVPYSRPAVYGACILYWVETISSKLQFPYGMDERLEFSTFHLKQYHVVFRTNDKLLFLVNRRLLFSSVGHRSSNMSSYCFRILVLSECCFIFTQNIMRTSGCPHFV